MRIKVSDIRSFFKRSSKIKNGGILPIYDLVKIEFTLTAIKLYKTNGHIFCKHEIEEEGAIERTIAIEEKRLVALVNKAVGEYIYFDVKGDNITIKDDENKAVLSLGDAINFPGFPENENKDESFVLSPEVVAALFEAKDFALKIALDTNFSFVYSVKKDNGYEIFASDRHILYVRKFSKCNVLPEFAITPEACAIIAPYQHVVYYTAGNYDFFDIGQTIYGFIKTTYTPPAYSAITDAIDRSQTMQVLKSNVVSYCEFVTSFSANKNPVIKIEDGEQSLMFSYDESEYNAGTGREIPVVKNYYPDTFYMNAELLAAVLKCFSTEEIIFSPANQFLYAITHPEEEGLTVGVALIQIS